MIATCLFRPRIVKMDQAIDKLFIFVVPKMEKIICDCLGPMGCILNVVTIPNHGLGGVWGDPKKPKQIHILSVCYCGFRRSVCAPYGSCRQNEMATVNSVFLSLIWSVFSPRRGCPRVVIFFKMIPPHTHKMGTSPQKLSKGYKTWMIEGEFSDKCVENFISCWWLFFICLHTPK